MATQSGASDFTSNLGKIYGIYTGGFFGFVVLLAILEQVGLPDRIIGYLFVFFTLAVYAIIGIVSRTMQVSEYYVAGRRVPAFYNGMATGADWMSAASFIGMAGTLYALGYDGLGYVLGWTGGYVLVAVLVAPYLRKFGAYTVPDFLSARYGGNFARFLGVIVLLSCSFTYVVAQIVGTGLIASRFIGMDFQIAVYVGLAGILVCSMLGGMRAVTWTQVAQYIVLIVAYLLPVVILSAQKFGLPIPELTYGQVLAADRRARAGDGATGPRDRRGAETACPAIRQPLGGQLFRTDLLSDGRHGVAAARADALLHDAKRARGAQVRRMVAAVHLHPLLHGAGLRRLREARGLHDGDRPALAELREQASTGCSNGARSVWSRSAASTRQAPRPSSTPAPRSPISPAHHPRRLKLDNDAIVIATPEIAGLPYVVSGLVAAGGLAAALSTADGLLLAIANALSHDIYYKMLDPNAPTPRRLIVARALLVLVAMAGAYTASFRPADIVAMVAWAFSLAAGGLFPALVLGIWWKRTTTAGAVCGIVAGFGITLLYLVVTRYYPVFGVEWLGMSSLLNAGHRRPGRRRGGRPRPIPETAYTTLASKVGWFNINNISSAIFGLPLGTLVMIVVSLLTPAPSREMQDFIDEVRRPRGDTMMKEKAA